MNSRVYVTQPLSGEHVERLRGHCALRVAAQAAPLAADALRADTADYLAQCEGIVCLLVDRIDARLLDAMPRLRFVSSVSVGVDHVDVAALSARGIPLGHTPGVLVEATADTAFALLLAAARRIAEGDRFVRAGQWRADLPWSPDFFLGRDVAGATLGIVGLGAIGQAVARRALGFGMRVLGWNRSTRTVPGVECVGLDALLAASDFVSLHVALTAETRYLLDAGRLARLKRDAVLVNTARGGIVDEQALAAALAEGRLYAAGLDVFEREPLPVNHPLLDHPRVVIAPHIGSATPRTRAAMLGRAVDNALAALAGQRMPYCVNPDVYR